MSQSAGPSVLGGSRLAIKAASRRPLLACYFPMGDPLFDDTMLEIYAAAGVDIIELGIPTSDPFLDGPDIKAAMARALAGPSDPYCRLQEAVNWLASEDERPAGVCMTYADLDFSKIQSETLAQLDGLLIVARDQSVSDTLFNAISAHCRIPDCGFLPIDFSDAEAARAQNRTGYIMIQASRGVTGVRDALDLDLDGAIARLRASGIKQKVLAGFGIGTAEQAREAVACGADGVVIGSMCMRKALEGRSELRRFLDKVRTTLDA